MKTRNWNEAIMNDFTALIGAAIADGFILKTRNSSSSGITTRVDLQKGEHLVSYVIYNDRDRAKEIEKYAWSLDCHVISKFEANPIEYYYSGQPKDYMFLSYFGDDAEQEIKVVYSNRWRNDSFRNNGPLKIR